MDVNTSFKLVPPIRGLESIKFESLLQWRIDEEVSCFLE